MGLTMGKSIVGKVVDNLERQGAAVGNAVREAAKSTAKAAPYLVSPELKAGSTAAKIGDKVAQKVAESIPAAKYGKAGGEVKSVRTSSDAPVTVSRLVDKTKVVTTSPKKVEYTTPKNSPAQRAGVQKAQDTKRATEIEGAASTATKAAGPEVAKLAQSGTKAINATKIAGTQAGHVVTTHDRKTGKAN